MHYRVIGPQIDWLSEYSCRARLSQGICSAAGLAMLKVLKVPDGAGLSSWVGFKREQVNLEGVQAVRTEILLKSSPYGQVEGTRGVQEIMV